MYHSQSFPRLASLAARCNHVTARTSIASAAGSAWTSVHIWPAVAAARALSGSAAAASAKASATSKRLRSSPMR